MGRNNRHWMGSVSREDHLVERLRMIRKILLASILLLSSQVALAQQEQPDKYQEGTHYFKIDKAPAKWDDDSDHNIEVTVIFNYLCGHCNVLDPRIDKWAEKKPANVTLNRMHVDFGSRELEMLSRGYIIAEMTGIIDQAHPAMMDAIWKHRRRFRNPNQLADFYANFGLKKDRFLANFNSFALDSQLRRNMHDVKIFGVTGTPCIVVNRKYLVQNTQSVLDVVDFLIAKETAAQ